MVLTGIIIAGVLTLGAIAVVAYAMSVLDRGPMMITYCGRQHGSEKG